MTTMISEDGPGIYAIRHPVTQRSYVGSTVGLRKRWQTHRRMLRNGLHHSILLQNAWNKYTETQFEFVILEIVKDKAVLVAREQHWIEALRSSDPKSGYNVCPKAYSKLGSKTSDITRKKQSIAKQGFRPVRTEEFLQKGKVFWIGKTRSQETREKMSASHTGKKRAPFTDTHRRNIRLSKLGTVATEAARAKLSKATTAYWQRKRMGVSP